MKEIFAECGTVKEVRFLKNKETGKPRGSFDFNSRSFWTNFDRPQSLLILIIFFNN